MAKEICISSTPHETRLAILEDDQLAEIYYERENEYTLAGSIYNGRVTRVLPGMQSAFVDLGLERDAFLYVTDFIELEDQEETDELEKAASTGQAPKEIQHHGTERNGGRQEDRGQRPGQRQDARQERRPTEEASPTVAAPSAPKSTPAAGQADATQTSEEAGGRRWRGRRRRRGGGGRGPGAPYVPATEGEHGHESSEEAGVEADQFPVVHEFEAHAARVTPRGGEQVSDAFVLPGESLSKYGGEPSETSKTATAPAAPAPPAPKYKPSTLIEAPIEWDGSGLLPGESISRHRSRQPELEIEAPSEPQPEASAEPADEFVQTTTIEDLEESEPPSHDEIESARQETAFEFEEEDLDAATIEPPSEEAPIPLEISEERPVDEEEFEEIAQTAEENEDASASHRVDPSAPTGFRLFGIGKKKKEADPEPETKPAAATATAVSTYAPGAGRVEEEVIEGEEFDSSLHRRHKPEVQDLDDYEEETLAGQARTGELGEMLQEAHLDHRIQLKFDEKGVENDEDEGEEEEEVATGTTPAPGRERRDRGGRVQRGRGAPSRGRGPSRRSAQTSDLPIISDLLKSGQEILVQIAKEPIAKKGARITSHIALPGRFLVFMPTVTHVGVSRKIASDEERHRLKRILVHERGEASGGFIVRTAAEGASEEELRADLRFLMNLWNDIKQRSESSKSPALIYHDLSLIERILRDQVSSNFASIWVDSQDDYERIVRFLNRFSPSLVRRVKLYTKEVPLFEHFGIQDEISKALRSKVWLKSGGSIVINQTEALVAIDINTGKYVGKSARLEDTILKTNLDAVPEIVRQIRLRDLGGIIVIDFIDMDERKNRFKVMAALEEALKNDRAPTKVLQFNDFGLVAITRKRVKQSLERTLSVPCPTCQATGMVKSAATVCNEIYTELRKMRKHFESADVMLRVNPETVKVLKSNGNRWLTEFEELVGKNILVKSDPTLHPEQFDIQG
jgi:Rne/Rng family ribonuclease